MKRIPAWLNPLASLRAVVGIREDMTRAITDLSESLNQWEAKTADPDLTKEIH